MKKSFNGGIKGVLCCIIWVKTLNKDESEGLEGELGSKESDTTSSSDSMDPLGSSSLLKA